MLASAGGGLADASAGTGVVVQKWQYRSGFCDMAARRRPNPRLEWWHYKKWIDISLV